MGKLSSRIKFSDAASRSVRVVNLQRLHSLLIGSLSWEQLGSMPALSMENFGADYQYGSTPFTVPVPIATTLPSVPQPCTAAPAAEGTATMPSKPNPPATKAKATKSKPKAKKAASTTTVNNAAAASSEATNSTSLVPSSQTTDPSTAVVSHTGKKGKFIIPRPGVDGAVAGVLNNKTFVLTGVFPEVGGGTGLVLGKDRTKAMIESFGGRVTSSVSGKTDFLVVGQEPGASKVSKAEERNLPLIDLLSLHRLLMGQQTIEAAASAPPPSITNFSAGYAGQKRISYY